MMWLLFEFYLSTDIDNIIVSLISTSICRFTRLFVLVAARLRIAYTTTA